MKKRGGRCGKRSEKPLSKNHTLTSCKSFPIFPSLLKSFSFFLSSCHRQLFFFHFLFFIYLNSYSLQLLSQTFLLRFFTPSTHKWKSYQSFLYSKLLCKVETWAAYLHKILSHFTHLCKYIRILNYLLIFFTYLR